MTSLLRIYSKREFICSVENIFHRKIVSSNFCGKIFSTVFGGKIFPPFSVGKYSLERRCEQLKFGHFSWLSPWPYLCMLTIIWVWWFYPNIDFLPNSYHHTHYHLSLMIFASTNIISDFQSFQRIITKVSWLLWFCPNANLSVNFDRIHWRYVFRQNIKHRWW